MKFQNLMNYRYQWPLIDIDNSEHWSLMNNNLLVERAMPEKAQELAADSRWPAFYPSPICLVTASNNGEEILERAVGATIVNRFPYVLALSFCRENLSERHYNRKKTIEIIENSNGVAVQFIAPGDSLDRAIKAIDISKDDKTNQRIQFSGLSVCKAKTNSAPVFADAYMVYECRLVKSGRDFENYPIHSKPFVDVGSHRLFFFEINAIQLNKEIAAGKKQIHWRSLPTWNPIWSDSGYAKNSQCSISKDDYQKGYSADYYFPSPKTTAFEYDTIENEMAVKYLPSLPSDQIEIDNDRARWPCFFPSSIAFVNSWAADGLPNTMPCGSTMVVSRQPMVIAVCVAYAAVNVRYRPRATLDMIRRTRMFGCAVPFIHEKIIAAIQYSGNISFKEDSEKVINSGLEWTQGEICPILPALPINFECRVINELRLGTHAMFLGEVCKITVRADLTSQNSMKWFPIAEVVTNDE